MLNLGIYNFQIAKKWDEMEANFDAVKSEHAALKRILSDQESLARVESKVKASRGNVNGSVLMAELGRLAEEAGASLSRTGNDSFKADVPTTRNAEVSVKAHTPVQRSGSSERFI